MLVSAIHIAHCMQEMIAKRSDACYMILSWLMYNNVLFTHAFSRGTKVEKMLTLAPERYTAGFCMVAKVI